MVEFNDGAIKAQLGVPDMRLPIRYALGDATRLRCDDPGLSFDQMANLTFERPDVDRFPSIRLGHYALSEGGTTACVINAANEIAVAAFLHEKIGFLDIHRIITRSLEKIEYIANPGYEDYVSINAATRAFAQSLIDNKDF
jgi:1-deoxy-D-xylulose-5-phosphate reductoisomerase